LLSRNCSAAVFGFGAATGAGANGFFSFFAAALFLEKLFGEYLDEFFAGFLPALFDKVLEEPLEELFDEALPLEAPGFLEEVARLAVDADFARGYLSFQSVQFR
jgi:hypothetical protein